MRAHAFRSSCLVVLGALSCATEPIPIGDDPKDDVVLSESRNLKHLADALGDDEITTGELLLKGADVVFNEAPDPTELLESTSALDDERSRAGHLPLSVLSYNVALLDAKIFGCIDYKHSPYLDERRDELPDLVLGDGWDIVVLQEVWTPEDVDAFRHAGDEHGYLSFAQERATHNDGVMILLREAIVEGGTSPTMGFRAYAAQDGLEYWPGPGIKRGYVHVAFVHDDFGPMRVFGTHAQAYPENWQNRARQMRELGIAVREESGGDEIVVVAGDMNAGPYYRKDEWEIPGGKATQWWNNAVSYALSLEYGDLLDAAIMGRSLANATADVMLGTTVKNDAEKALETPGVEDDWCGNTPHTTFTATDCNSLYFEQYAGTEYPARLDHVLIRDREERVVVTGSRLVYTDKRSFDGVDVEPSDHYGVAVDLLIAPR